MKNLITILALIGFTLNAFGQNTVVFEYDNSGNRVLREIDWEFEQKHDSTEEEVFWSEVQLYPNPTQGWITLNIPEKLKGVTLQLFSLTGNVLMEQTLEASQERIDLSSFPQGTYYCTLYSEEHEGKWQIVKLQ